MVYKLLNRFRQLSGRFSFRLCIPVKQMDGEPYWRTTRRRKMKLPRRIADHLKHHHRYLCCAGLTTRWQWVLCCTRTPPSSPRPTTTPSWPRAGTADSPPGRSVFVFVDCLYLSIVCVCWLSVFVDCLCLLIAVFVDILCLLIVCVC